MLAPDALGLRDFEGASGAIADGMVLEGPLSAVNASALRANIPSLRPQPVGLATSAGVGDRLGLATPGHVRAFRKYGAGIVPVFAQQSMREMDRLERTPQQVLDDATFGCLEGGWVGAVGADADHLKSTVEIDRCLAAGFTSFTLDPGEHVRDVPAVVSTEVLGGLPWAALEDDAESMARRYTGLAVEAEGTVIRIEEEDIRRAAAKYGDAVAYTVSMYRHLLEHAGYPVEVEVSVDETESPTTVAEHVYMATEMKRLGMTWVSFAPRYVGGFEKGIEYLGDTTVFFNSLVAHASIARAMGPYKISLHSGSDKFSIYELAVAATGRLVHLKTSGTSYLEALGVAARRDPALFREIYDVSRDAYRSTRASYQVSAQLERTAVAGDFTDEQLPALVTNRDSRQILHVGYGAVLTSRDDHGSRWMSDALRSLLSTRAEEYELALETHLGRHLVPFAEPSR
ncbi:tagaturonate epimerase family protein [Cryobacterium sp. TMS1-20-1]|uniref:tagaturonate epimerase family protein n=1 Tax=Cryobacterium sp. TMS1-20-1 TaxID=1259223 RepID=UPI00141AB0F9|nr:tagaturonate epimerase family protein [Cryobacterium sp. TMS1-20-1]